MSQNFVLVSNRTNDILHLQMLGEFDGSSACELVARIREDGSGASKILIDTTQVKSIHPFGKTVLHNRLGQLSRKLIGLKFTGTHKNQFE